MRMFMFTPREEKKLKMAVRAAKLHEYLKKNGVLTIFFPSFNFRKISPYMLMNYMKLIFFLVTKRKTDIVLFENERQARFLNFFKRLGYILALDIRDNRALQRSAYQLDDSPEKLDTIQKLLLKNIEICDYVFTVSQSCKKLYPHQYHNKIFVIENASDPHLFTHTQLPDELNVGFISGIAPGRGIELLIQAIHLVKQKVPEVKLSIAGTPAKHYKKGIDYYRDLKTKHGSDWITFREDIFYSANASRFLRDCYVTVIPHPDHIYYHTTLPVKLFDFLASGRPVVSTNCKETARILRTYDCGLVTDFIAQDLAEKIVQLLSNKKLASKMGVNGRKVIEEIYNWNNMAKKMIDIMSGYEI
jgi:glycosyltransferase involved in cell wall biosynthesis